MVTIQENLSDITNIGETASPHNTNPSTKDSVQNITTPTHGIISTSNEATDKHYPEQTFDLNEYDSDELPDLVFPQT